MGAVWEEKSRVKEKGAAQQHPVGERTISAGLANAGGGDMCGEDCRMDTLLSGLRVLAGGGYGSTWHC